LPVPLGRSSISAPSLSPLGISDSTPAASARANDRENQTSSPSNAAVFSAEAHRAPLRENRNTRAGVMARHRRRCRSRPGLAAPATTAEAWYTLGQGVLSLREREGAPENRVRVNREATAIGMDHVRYFLAVAEELNFTKAAEKCNVAQPSLTRAIKLLEEEFGGSLFSSRASEHASLRTW